MEAQYGRLYKDGELIGLISDIIEITPELENNDSKENNVRYLSSKPVEFSGECKISDELIKALRIQEVMNTYVLPAKKLFFVEPDRGRQKLFLQKYIHGKMIYPTKMQTLTERFLSYDLKYDKEKYEVYCLVDSKKKYNRNKRIQKKWRKRTQIVRYILVEKEQMCGLDFDVDICTLIVKM